MYSRALAFTLCILPLAGCGNRHLHKDKQHLAFEAAARRYQQDCPVTATVGNAQKTAECQTEHDQLAYEFQKTQATDRGDCDRTPAERPAICGSR